MPADMKSIIADAYIDLTKKKNIDKITVKDLVEACDISRQTFYYHFQDILAVSEWSARQALQKALEQSREADSQEAAMKIFIQAAVDKYDLMQKLLHSQNRETVEGMLMETVKECLRERLRRNTPDIPPNYLDTKMALDFYAAGVTTVLVERCGEKDLDVDQLARQLCRLLKISGPDEV